MAGDRIWHGLAKVPPRISREDLWHSISREVTRSLEHRLEDAARFVVEPMLLHPRSDDGVVMGPNCSEVIADGIEPPLVGRERANAPSCKQIFSHEALGDHRHAFISDDAGPK